jgi:hypothetical protein
MRATYHFDPHAPGIVNVGHDRSNRPARHARNIFGPQLGRQVLDQIRRHTIVRQPRVDYCLSLFDIFRRARDSTLRHEFNLASRG